MSFDIRRPALLTLPVRDLARSLAFWEALGMPVKLRARGIAELQTNGIVVMLVETPDAPAAPAGIGPRLAFECDDLAGARERLARAGLPCETVSAPEGVDAQVHGSRLLVRDPDGFGVEIACWRSTP